MEIKKHYASASEAIREGAKMRPQAFGALFLNGKTCAIGAAGEALFIEFADYVNDDPLAPDGMQFFDSVLAVYPYLKTAKASCPEIDRCHCKDNYGLITVITHLNDDHCWTREEIADWLEREEEKLGYVTLEEPETQDTASGEARAFSAETLESSLSAFTCSLK